MCAFKDQILFMLYGAGIAFPTAFLILRDSANPKIIPGICVGIAISIGAIKIAEDIKELRLW